MGFVVHDSLTDHYRIEMRVWELGQLDADAVRQAAASVSGRMGYRNRDTG